MIEQAKHFGKLLLDVLYPRICPVCRDVVIPKGGFVCTGCREKLPYVAEPACMRCGRPMASEQEEFCDNCSRQSFSYERGFAVFAYDDVMQQAVADFKYGNRRELADFFAEEMADVFQEKLSSFGAEALVPVPVHKARKRYRGYNQAEVLCKLLAGYTGIPVRELLERDKKTAPQKELDASDRLRNLEQAIELHPKEQESRMPKIIVLVDDIYTTGSTAEACARTLLRAGVEKVFLLNLCIVTEQ